LLQCGDVICVAGYLGTFKDKNWAYSNAIGWAEHMLTRKQSAALASNNVDFPPLVFLMV
jgi:hypothetical protein